MKNLGIARSHPPGWPPSVRRIPEWAARAAKIARQTSLFLSVRGLVLLLFLLYLLKGPVLGEADIIASVLAYSMLIVIFAASVTTLVYGHLLRRALQVSIVPQYSSDDPIDRVESGKQVAFVIKIDPLHVPPLYEMNLELRFPEEGVRVPMHTLKGRPQVDRRITEEIVFPHRGLWEIRGAKLSFGDQLGLTSLAWEIGADEIGHGFTVYPPRIEENRLPVKTSCFRTGDDVVDVHERRGEPFDLKRYHPSDGIRKIVWKIFAKSGELLSRHAEPAMSPEGQVAVFCLAKPEEDGVCSTTVAYVRRLQELDLQIFFSCEGMPEDELARSAEEAEEALLAHVWRARTEAPSTVLATLDNFEGQVNKVLHGPRLERMLIFLEARRFASEEGLHTAARIGEVLEARRIQPVFFLVGEQPAGRRTAPREVRPVRAALAHWFFSPPQGTPPQASRYYPEFMSLSLAKGWDVVSQEPV